MTNAASLRHLFADWANGATIAAGTGMFPKLPDHPRVAKKCASCETWVFGAGEEAAHRLAEHKRRAHG